MEDVLPYNADLPPKSKRLSQNNSHFGVFINKYLFVTMTRPDFVPPIFDFLPHEHINFSLLSIIPPY